MKNKLALLLLLLLSALAAPARDFTIGRYDTFHSRILNEDRRLLVYIPPTPAGDSVRYPVMYLLDGESHFTKTVGILDFLSRTAGNEVCPQMIIVAVIHNNRERELVPPIADPAAPVEDKFASFMQQELIPYIDAHYPTTPYRVFAGHSLGGLRVVNTCIYQPQLFNAYIALDPSLGHVRKWLARGIDDFGKAAFRNQSLHIAMGMTMPPGTDTATIFRDTTSNARHMRSIMTFAYNATNNPKNGLAFSWKYYPDESHQSVVFKGTYDGLTTCFHWFRNEHLYDVFRPDVTPDSAVRVITRYYEYLSGKMGYTIIAPEQGTAELIDYLNFKKWYDKAYAFAQLNYNNYPNSRRTKQQLDEAMWNSRKPLEPLLQTRKARDVYNFCKQIAQQQQPEYNISEDAINTLGYNLMNQNKLSDAGIFFRLNTELYPNSFNVHDSYGEWLLLSRKTKEGVAAYKRSLELNPANTNARKVLEQFSGAGGSPGKQ